MKRLVTWSVCPKILLSHSIQIGPRLSIGIWSSDSTIIRLSFGAIAARASSNAFIPPLVYEKIPWW